MKQKFPTMRGNEIKALLVGSADTSTTLFSKALAPVSRIGGGEVQAGCCCFSESICIRPQARLGQWQVVGGYYLLPAVRVVLLQRHHRSNHYDVQERHRAQHQQY